MDGERMLSERRAIRIMLSDNALSYVWLAKRLEENGVFATDLEVSAAIRGTRKGAKADTIISESFYILSDYEKKTGVRRVWKKAVCSQKAMS